MNNLFLVVWDCYGLEYIDSLREVEQDQIWCRLKGEPSLLANSMSLTLNSILMRARVNNQRHYEIYTIQTDESVTLEDMKTAFESMPQQIVNMIRDSGTCIFDGRETQQRLIV